MSKATEHGEQCAVIEWVRLNENRIPALRLLYAIPNGGHRNIVTAMKLKAEGVRRGVPDLCLPIPVADEHGLYVEMKVRGGRTSPEQDEFIFRLWRNGYRVEVCYGADEAITAIKRYLAIDDEMPFGDLEYSEPRHLAHEVS